MRARPHIMMIVFWLFLGAMLVAGIALLLGVHLAEAAR